ncbi:PREDICTED: probable disease resistance protein RF9 [Theobroma cacao]|uniref:Probable disease resistance protein RF9 n=1 Tax=Theobroma cacao TaxID=3641 RepID=A0AB32WY00_THECC|nr:PREDICTED: probable disease resistance protein RF9 [Theobroma cacao]
METLAPSPWKTTEASLVKAMDNLSNLLIFEQELLDGFEEDFRLIQRGLARMHLMAQNVIEEKGLEGYGEEVRFLTTQVEAVTDGFISRKQKSKQPSCSNCIKDSFPFFKGRAEIYKLIDDIEIIRASILRLISKGSELGMSLVKARTGTASQNLEQQKRPFSVDDIKEERAVGLEEGIHILVSRLTDGKGNRKVISITGARGVGKTTLAMEVYKSAAVTNHFPSRAWVTLSQDFELKETLQILAKQLWMGKEEGESSVEAEELSVEELSTRIKDALKNGRHLIVLDNVRTLKQWDALQSLFPVESRILITTRDRAVALSTESDHSQRFIYHMRGLSDEEGWELFTAKLPPVPMELEELGRDIVKKCMGSPRAISAAAEILSSTPATLDHWSIVLEQIDKDQASTYHNLSLVADALPSPLKLCLSYCALFDKNYDISVRRLIVLWVAEGLIEKQNGSKKAAEDIAEKYLKQLENQGMIQVVKWKSNGKIKKCRMHHLLRDQWVSKAKKASLVQVPDEAACSCSSSSTGMIRRVADHLDKQDDSFRHIHGNRTTNNALRSYYGDLRSLLSFDFREGPEPGDDIGNFLRRGILGRFLLRLLIIDLEGVFRPKLPKGIGKLKELRYLGLRGTYLEMLPSSIGYLPELQTLDLKNTHISTLPNTIWKMQRLRHLYLSDRYRCRFVAPPSACSPIDLQTLWGAFLDEESPVEGGLNRLINLRKLGLVIRLTLSQQKSLAKWIARLIYLESLRLRSIDESVQPSTLFLRPLSNLKNLSSIYLMGRLNNPLVVQKLPENLTEITLSLSGLLDDPMPNLGKLPNLRVLELLADSFTGTLMVCSTGGFPLLRVLKLWKLQGLEVLVVQIGALAIVKDIEIRYCENLKMIPNGFLHLVHCRELKLKDLTEVRGIHGELIQMPPTPRNDVLCGGFVDSKLQSFFAVVQPIAPYLLL